MVVWVMDVEIVVVIYQYWINEFYLYFLDVFQVEEDGYEVVEKWFCCDLLKEWDL